jgi:hypothetical protein
MRPLLLAAIVALAGCHHPVSPPTTQPPAKRSNWVLAAAAKPDDSFCVEWTVDVEAGDSRPFSCMSVATVRRLVRGQRFAE